MDAPRFVWLSADRPEPGLQLKVLRLPRPSLSWVWEFYRDDDAGFRVRSLKGYQSAEEAFQAGRAALADRAGMSDPAR
jgi:hypothetical protein